MHPSTLVLHLLFAASPLQPTWTQAPSPTARLANASSPPLSSTAPSRWDGAGTQWLAGSAGGAAGALGGGLLGGLIGAGMSSGSDGLGQLGAVLLGAVVGGSVGGVSLEVASIRWASSDAYPTRNVVPAAIGSVLGIAAGILVIHRVAAASPTYVDWGIWPGFATIIGCSSLGAVLIDRVAATPRSVSVSPWLPHPGFSGAVASLAF